MVGGDEAMKSSDTGDEAPMDDETWWRWAGDDIETLATQTRGGDRVEKDHDTRQR